MQEAQNQHEIDNHNQALYRAQMEAQHAYRLMSASEINEQQAVALTSEAESREADAKVMIEALQNQLANLRKENSTSLHTIYQQQKNYENKLNDYQNSIIIIAEEKQQLQDA